MIFCYFITNKNFDNCCVFPTVKNMSNIFVTCYLKNNHIKCFSFLEDCRIFLQDMHFSWPINICSALAVQEDEVKTSRVWFSLQPPCTRGTLVKTGTGNLSEDRPFMDIEHAAALAVCPQWDAQLWVPLSLGVNSLTAENCWFWGQFLQHLLSFLLSLSIWKLSEQGFEGKLIQITKNVNVK